jgi:S-adenosylmethionine decarboxylase
MNCIGKQVLADFSGVDKYLLLDPDNLMSVIRSILVVAGVRVLREIAQDFPGECSGITGIFVLAESHLAFHSYPEYAYLAVDVFTCGGFDPMPIAEQLSQRLKPLHVRFELVERVCVIHEEGYKSSSSPANAHSRKRSGQDPRKNSNNALDCFQPYQ